MTEQQKVKIQQSLVFEQSELWDSIIAIIDEASIVETNIAIGFDMDESKRQHQCGRADSLRYIKELLETTRHNAMANAGRRKA